MHHHTQSEHHPIYYSVQPDFSQDQYMDVCTLLPLGLHNGFSNHASHMSKNRLGLNGNLAEMDIIETHRNKIEYLNIKSGSGGGGGGGQCNLDRCDNSLSASGSNSTTSSKLKLTSSPTDSLAKSSMCLQPSCSNCVCCASNVKASSLNLEDDYENNAFQIMRLINEHKTCVRPAKYVAVNKTSNKELSNFDLYAFNLHKSGGLIEIPKYCKFK